MKQIFRGSWCIVALFFSTWAGAQQISSDTIQASARAAGKKVAERFLTTSHGRYNTRDKAHIPYFEVCTWYGALTLAQETHNAALTNNLAQRFEPLFSTENFLLPESYHVDFNVFGALALELYLQIKDKRYLDLGLPYADKQWNVPADSGLTQRALDYARQGYS